MRLVLGVVVLLSCLGGGAWGQDVSGHIESARGAYGRGDQLRAFSSLQQAVHLLSDRLTEQFGRFLPSAPAGWEPGPIEGQSLEAVGGGLQITRSYSKGEAALNAALTVDNPSVGSSAALLRSDLQAGGGWTRLKVGQDDALLRFDPATHSGEITMMVGERVLLQVEGTEISRDDVLVEIAKGWNMAGIRKIVGAGS